VHGDLYVKITLCIEHRDRVKNISLSDDKTVIFSKYDSYDEMRIRFIRTFSCRLMDWQFILSDPIKYKISSEIRVVSGKTDNISRDTENKITTLNNTIESLRECMNEGMNAHVV